jgi:hypothetical protein
MTYPHAATHFDWPDATTLHDRDTITVDRISATDKVPPHRFLIRRGDTVSVSLANQQSDTGVVVGISQARNEVCVRFDEGTAGTWFTKGAIYPAKERVSAAVLPEAPIAEGLVLPSPTTHDPALEHRVPAPITVKQLAAAILSRLGEQPGRGMTPQELAQELGRTACVPDAPDASQLEQAVDELRCTGKIHVTQVRGRSPILSVLTWPTTPQQWSHWSCPDSLAGAEVVHLMNTHQVTIAELATRMQITQKRIREVREGAGLQGNHTVRDWVEAIISPGIEGACYTLEDHADFRRRAVAGELTVTQWQAEFERMLASRRQFIVELVSTRSALELKSLAQKVGEFCHNRHTKHENARAVYRQLLQMFVIADGLRYDPLRETAEQAITREVREMTQEALDAYYTKLGVQRAAHHKALSEPETLQEFHEFVRYRGVAALTDAQLATYDQLRADLTREKRRSEKQPETVEALSTNAVHAQLQIREGHHAKRNCPLWTVSLTDRVDRTAFLKLKTKAQQLGGWYSSFIKSQAGFQFLSRASAEKFVALLTADQSRTEELADKRQRGHLTAAERLTQLAMELHGQAEETIEQSKHALQNTARRADMQAGIRGRAYADQALARTITRVAAALQTGQVKYLDGIRHKTHLELLARLARQAQALHQRQAASDDRAECSRPVDLTDVRHVIYPYPSIWKSRLQEAIQWSSQARGAKLACQRMAKRLRDEAGDFVHFKRDEDVAELADFLPRVKSAGFDTQWMEREVADYKRLHAADIFTLPELRCALRELVPLLGEVATDSPAERAERDLIGRDLPGFFPTPPAIVERMLPAAALERHHRILEPSVGKGDIADAIRRQFPDAQLTVIELNHTLADVLSAKGYEPVFEDFLQFRRGEKFDRILMNPPFERGLDIDHVLHAYRQLARDGRLVAIMSEGTFSRSDQRAEYFRTWLNQVGGTSEALPDDAFAGRDAFRQTSVRTRMVVIHKSPV